MMRAVLSVVVVACSVLPGLSYAQLPERLSPSARVEVLTMAPGAAVHAVFGHSALRVVDPELGLDAVFNYGTFDPTDPLFVPKFIYGDMQYFVSAAPGAAVVRAYAAEGRSVYAQRIRMTPGRTAALYAALRTNLEPENRTYLYDFVRDNCSTRLIDLLVLYAGVELSGLELARAPGHSSAAPGPSNAAPTGPESAVSVPDVQEPGSSPTYRSLIRSYLAPYPWLDLGIDLVLGAPMERPPSARERTFLPFELMAALGAATVPAGPDSVAADSLATGSHSAGSFAAGSLAAGSLAADSLASDSLASDSSASLSPHVLPAVVRTDTLFAGTIQGPSLGNRPQDSIASRDLARNSAADGELAQDEAADSDLAWGGSARPRFVWPFRLAALLLTLVAFLPGRHRAARADRVDRVLVWITSIAGLFLLFMWIGTQHTVTAWNTNLLWAFPLNVLLLRRSATREPSTMVMVRTLSIVAAACCALAALTPILPIQSVPAAIWPFTLLLTALHLRRRRLSLQWPGNRPTSK